MAELTVEQRLDRLEGYAQTVCWRCEKMIPVKEAHLELHYGYLYIDAPLDKNMVLCHDCYSDYQELISIKEREIRDSLSNYMKEIKRKKYNLKY